MYIAIEYTCISKSYYLKFNIVLFRTTTLLEFEITKVQKRIKRGYQDLTCILLQRDLRDLNHEIQTRQPSGAEGGYEDIPYELIPMDNDSYERPSQIPRSNRYPQRRLSTYQSIGDDHYELMAIIEDPYEAPLRRSTSSPGTGYQSFVPYKMPMEGSDWKYSIEQADRASLSSFTEEKRALGEEGIIDGSSTVTIQKPYRDESMELPLPYPLPKGFADVPMQENVRNPAVLTDESQSRGRDLSRKRRKLRERMDRIKEYMDDDFDGDWMQLEKIKEKEQEIEDANFISQLLSNVKKEPVTRAVPGFRPFTIPVTLPKFKQEKEKEDIPLSEFSFLEFYDGSNDFKDSDLTDTDQASSLADHVTPKAIKQAQHDLLSPPERKRYAESDTLTDPITPKAIKQVEHDLVPAPVNKGDDEEKTAVTRMFSTEKSNNASNDRDSRCDRERTSVKEFTNKSVEEHIAPVFCLAELDFNVDSECESESSDYLEPVINTRNHGPDTCQNLRNDTKGFCVVEVDFDVKRKDRYLESENDDNAEGSDEIRNNMFTDLCIADLNFNVQNLDPRLNPSWYSQENVDMEGANDVTSTTASTGLCIAELNFEIEDIDCVSESVDYVEPIESRVTAHIESCVTAHITQDKESETEKYETLQNITDTKLCIPDTNPQDMQSKQSDETTPKNCLADIDFQAILLEVEVMEKSALDISYSADKGYERLRNKDINITIPEEDLMQDTLVKSDDEAPDTGFPEIRNLRPLGVEGEDMDEEIQHLVLQVVESVSMGQAASDQPHGSHDEEIRINVQLDSEEDHYDHIAS
jgi:hypothetical protein